MHSVAAATKIQIQVDTPEHSPTAVAVAEDKKAENRSLLGNFNRQVDVGQFENMIVPRNTLRGLRNEIAKFYEAQNEVLFGLKEMANFSEGDFKATEQAMVAESSAAHLAIQLSFGCTFILLAIKVSAAVWSQSMAVLASSVDSGLDVLSQMTLLIISRALRRHDPYKYPTGRSRLEPLGILMFAIIMGMASIFLLYESISHLIDGLQRAPDIRIDGITLGLMCSAIVIQLGMYFYCKSVSLRHNDNASAAALAQDHLNDVCVNFIGGIPAVIAGYVSGAWFMDSVGAICISIYIGVRWTVVFVGQISSLVGRAAPPSFVGKLTYLAATHDVRIKAVDTVLAYHIGYRYQCEVHIVLDGNMILRDTHDIGESLQKKIEALPEVETAFVHMDYESDHKPEYLRRIRRLQQA